MLPNEYVPLVLTDRQQDVHRRYTAIGFSIAARPFAGRGDHLHFFCDLPTPDDRKGKQFTLNLHSGILHQTGTHEIWEMDAAEIVFSGDIAVFENLPSTPVVKPPATAPQISNGMSYYPAYAPVVQPPAPAPVKKKQPSLF